MTDKLNILIAQGGGPTAVINASLAGVILEAKKSGRANKIYGAIGGIEGFLAERLIELSPLREEELRRLKNTPGAALGSCRYKVNDNDHRKILKVLKKRKIDCFFYIGGNDSMDTCHKISQLDTALRVVGIPKTIDNDLPVTDHCPGFGSAARYAAVSVRELGLDVRSLPIHISFIELMGRNAGWLTAAGGFAREIGGDAPDLIYLPERVFRLESFLSDIEKAWKKKKGLVVAVSEGLCGEDGLLISEAGNATDSFGHSLAGDAGSYLAKVVRSRLGIRARSEKPGILQRSSRLMASETDREEAFQVGQTAVRKALEGETGIMIAIIRRGNDPYEVDYSSVRLSEVANVEHFMPDEYINSKDNYITRAFIDYIRPLVGTDFNQDFILPNHNNEVSSCDTLALI